jgi:hypothetical protein
MNHRFEAPARFPSRTMFCGGRRYIGLSVSSSSLTRRWRAQLHYSEGLPWLDSLLNAAMILGGMGPVDPVRTTAGKWFASFYALFSGMVLLVAVSVLIAPVFHRFLHRFHLEIDSPR